MNQRAAELHEERRRAREAGQEYADALDLGIQLDPGAPVPHLLANGHSAFMLFYLRAGPAGNATVASPRGSEPEPLALLEFTGVHAVLFGGPNDEARTDIAFTAGAWNPYAIHEIRASRWISEAERVNSIHPYYQGGWHACCGTW